MVHDISEHFVFVQQLLDSAFHLKLEEALRDKSNYHLHVTMKEGGAEKVK